MIDVCSADGMLTKGDDPHVPNWSSSEDMEYFLAMRDSFRLLIMGRATYEVMRPSPEAERMRVVLTGKPEQFAAKAVPDQLEFSAASPGEIVQQLESRGYNEALLLGGGHINGAFLQAGLVTELHLTIEPVLFGAGVPLLGGLPADISLQLLSYKQLNERGTLLLHYSITATA